MSFRETGASVGARPAIVDEIQYVVPRINLNGGAALLPREAPLAFFSAFSALSAGSVLIR